MNNKVLIIGADGFTGKHLISCFEQNNLNVIATSRNSQKLKCDITDKQSIKNILLDVQPDYIINMAAISFVAHGNNNDFYAINTVGAINILDSLIELDMQPKKVMLSSSAVVYGNQQETILHENLTPNPINHYGMSKYAMELLAKSYFDRLNIIITRPFNYTGVGQLENFVIPKIVSHYKQKEQTIELGNLDVFREYNDVEYICNLYLKLMLSEVKSETVNLCSGKTYSLQEVISIMNKLAGYDIEIKVNPKFVRANEIKFLAGDVNKLKSLIGNRISIDIQTTISKMYQE